MSKKNFKSPQKTLNKGLFLKGENYIINTSFEVV